MSTLADTEQKNSNGQIVTVTAEPAATAVVAADTKTISGLVLPWGTAGQTSLGPLVFQRGTINVPTDISRVKLLAGHSPEGVPVGVATGWHVDDDGLHMSFTMGSSAAATDALAAAADHVVDSFSIEAMGIQRQGNNVTESLLKAVALVPFPAFKAARVQHVNAEENTAPDSEEDHNVTDGTEEENSTSQQRPATGDSDEDHTAGEEQTTPEEEQEDDPMNAPKLTPGTLPGMDNQGTTAHAASYDDMLTFMGAVARGEDTTDMLAELTDITASGMVDTTAPQWLGELWSGVTYQRRIIPLITSAPLKSMKARGYRWTTKPGVGKYSGDKTEIPSKPAAVEPVERDAQRWAGGNDLDRKFWDFGETEFLNAYWRAMAEDYSFQTDQDTAAFLNTSATTIDGTAPNLIRAVARGSLAIERELKRPGSFAIINPNDLESVLDLSELDAPKFMNLIPLADPSRWTTSEFVEQGTVLVGEKSAATFYELSGSPIRVEAEHIARGGRDAALFGYTAHMLNKPEGLVKVAFNAAAPIEPAPAG